MRNSAAIHLTIAPIGFDGEAIQTKHLAEVVDEVELDFVTPVISRGAGLANRVLANIGILRASGGCCITKEGLLSSTLDAQTVVLEDVAEA